jgi:carbonic anhydrase
MTFKSDLSELRELNEAFFKQDTGLKARDRRLVELNVLAQIHWLMQQPSVTKAISERGMQVHGFVYDSAQRSCVRLEITSSTSVSLFNIR